MSAAGDTGSGSPCRVWAVVPAKSFARAKSRLGGVLDDAARSALARQMLAHVLGLTRACSALAGTLVITDGDDVATLAADGGAHVLRDPRPGMTLAQVVDAGLVALLAHGADAALVLMADLPELAEADLHALLAALADADVVLAADHLGQHTNALGLRLGLGLSTCFGSAHSLAEHEARARGLGLRTQRVVSERLALDIDSVEDLRLSAR